MAHVYFQGFPGLRQFGEIWAASFPPRHQVFLFMQYYKQKVSADRFTRQKSVSIVAVQGSGWRPMLYIRIQEKDMQGTVPRRFSCARLAPPWTPAFPFRVDC